MAEASPHVIINRLFSIIDASLLESKEQTIKTFENISSLDIRTQSALQLQIVKHLATLKVAVDKYKVDIGGVGLAVDTLSNGLTPEQALVQLLTSKLNVNNK